MQKKKKRILPGLTTTWGSDWKEKIKEIKKHNIREIALFPTAIQEEERKLLYLELEKIPNLRVPHVHIRNDMKLWELDYLADRFRAEVFNTHPARKFPPKHDFSKYAHRMYIENSVLNPTRAELMQWAGLCIDFAHWENFVRVENPEYYDFEQKISDFGAGCGHISAIKDNPKLDKEIAFGERWAFDSHWMDSLQDLKYIKKYLKYIPDIVSIELANPFRTQLKVKEYLEMIINR